MTDESTVEVLIQRKVNWMRHDADRREIGL
jgi:hypothetical protein